MSSPENDIGDPDKRPRQLSGPDRPAPGGRDPHEAASGPCPVPSPVPPSPRFTRGVRIGIVVAVVIFGGLVVWNRYDADRALSPLAAVLLGLAVLLAAVGLVQAWCWVGRPRFSRSRSEAITAGLPLETRKTVRRMARGRAPDVPELRPWAAAYARAQHQNTSLSVAGLALINVSNLSQATQAIIGLLLPIAILLITGGVLGWALWMGHRARVLAVHLPTGPTSPTGSHVDGESR